MQEKVYSIESPPTSDQISLKEIILGIRNWFWYLLKKWYLIIAFALIGALLGLWYASTRVPVYTATTTFVLENGSVKGGLGQYAGVASMMGIDVGGGGGLFQGENILELYKSRSMITQTLLSTYNFDGRLQMLIDRFIEYNDLRTQWSRRSELKKIQFNPANKYGSFKEQLLHDSIMGQIVKQVSSRNLEVGKTDKKVNLVAITVKSPDEVFAKALNERLVETVNSFYLETKSKKNIENIEILQAKVDSVRSSLSGAISRSAAVADATPNQNPTRMAQRLVPIQNNRVSAEINQGVLATLLQNLETSKIALLKETPLIQIVDAPILPLESNGFGKLKGLIIGTFAGAFLIALMLIFRKFIKNILEGV